MMRKKAGRMLNLTYGLSENIKLLLLLLSILNFTFPLNKTHTVSFTLNENLWYTQEIGD